MEIKLLEIRDRGTTIPALAIRLFGRTEAERWLLERSGFSGPCAAIDAEEPYVVLMKLVSTMEAQYDPYSWRMENARTMPKAHLHLLSNWHTVATGDVVDVEFLLGERAEPKVSERMEVRR